MIRATSLATPYQTVYSNGTSQAIADVPPEKGGTGQGIGPHELLEAALATCLTMTVQMAANRRGWPLNRVESQVKLDRSQPGFPVLRYSLTIDGDLTSDQRSELSRAAQSCPVSKTLLGSMSVKAEAETEAEAEAATKTETGSSQVS